MGKLQRAGWSRRLLMTLLFVLTYPFIVMLHLVAPGTKVSVQTLSAEY